MNYYLIMLDFLWLQTVVLRVFPHQLSRERRYNVIRLWTQSQGVLKLHFAISSFRLWWHISLMLKPSHCNAEYCAKYGQLVLMFLHLFVCFLLCAPPLITCAIIMYCTLLPCDFTSVNFGRLLWVLVQLLLLHCYKSLKVYRFLRFIVLSLYCVSVLSLLTYRIYQLYDKYHEAEVTIWKKYTYYSRIILNFHSIKAYPKPWTNMVRVRVLICACELVSVNESCAWNGDGSH